MQASLQDLVGRTEVYNVGGAGGTIGLSHFRNLEGQPSQLMVMGLVMVGAIAANDSVVTLDEVTPIAELTTENLVIVVPADSDIQTIDDLVAAIEEDVGEVSCAGGSAGRRRADPRRAARPGPRARPRRRQLHRPRGGGEAIATLLSGSATAGSAASRSSCPRSSRRLRAIAVSGDRARSTSFPTYPRCRRRAIDVELTNWRGVVAPPGITDEQEQALEDLIIDMTESDCLARGARPPGLDARRS